MNSSNGGTPLKIMNSRLKDNLELIKEKAKTGWKTSNKKKK